MKLKNYRKWVPLLLIVLMGLSWYSLLDQVYADSAAYNDYLAEARRNADLGITKYAMENYLKALEIKDDIDVNIEIANYYRDNSSNTNDYISWCHTVFTKFPTEPKAIDCILAAHYTAEDYKSCYEVIRIASKRNIKSDYVSQIDGLIAYKYQLDYASYEDVSTYGNGLAAVKSKDLWGYIDRYGKIVVPCRYQAAGHFTQSGFAPVVDKDNKAFFIDQEGEKAMATNDAPYRSFGILLDDTFTAVLGEKTYYLDKKFKPILSEYEEGTAMYNGVAAVRAGSNWTLINKNGQPLVAETFQDVVRDERDIVCINDRLFVKKGGLYSLIDKTGKTLVADQYEEACLFASESLAAVKIGGQWGFIDKDGNIKIQPQFEDARSFANGLAAVQINGRWGFIDESGNVVIAPEFYGAKNFNDKGACFVQVGNNWQLLKIYRLNVRE